MTCPQRPVKTVASLKSLPRRQKISAQNSAAVERIAGKHIENREHKIQ
jgi:hypothetical protein